MARTSDQQRVASAAKGDSRAWASLVEQYGPYVEALLRDCRAPEADLADGFQYVFVELHRALPSLRSESSIVPWIKRVAIRHAIRLRQKAARFTSMPEAESPSDFDVHEEVERAEIGRLVREAISTLTDRCKQLIEGLFLEDPPRSYAAVASDIGLKTSSLAMTRQRCLEALEQALLARGIL